MNHSAPWSLVRVLGPTHCCKAWTSCICVWGWEHRGEGAVQMRTEIFPFKSNPGLFFLGGGFSLFLPVIQTAMVFFLPLYFSLYCVFIMTCGLERFPKSWRVLKGSFFTQVLAKCQGENPRETIAMLLSLSSPHGRENIKRYLFHNFQDPLSIVFHSHAGKEGYGMKVRTTFL